MTRKKTLAELKRYFQVKELVCDHIYAKWGESSWQFIPTFALENLLFLRRDVIGRPMVCNTKDLHQRGLRCNLCPIVDEKDVVYMSTHRLGIGWDFTVQGMTAEEARNLIKAAYGKFPHPCRIEAGVRWLHFDCLPQYGIDKNVSEFKILVIFLMLGICLASCSTARFRPSERDSTVVRYIDKLRIRDSVVMVGIPVESSSQNMSASDTSHLETSVARSDAWVDSKGKIHHTLNNKSDKKLPAIVPVYDRARMLDERQIITITKTVKVEKVLTWWQKFRLKAFWWLAGLIAASVIAWIVRHARKL